MAKEHKVGPVYAGGPAVDLMPDQIEAITNEPCPVPPLWMHNPLATFTTRGCVNKCPFCAVPKIEGELRELDVWPVRPVVCDNNLLAASRGHFDRAIDRLKAMPYVDFNQGLDARKFNAHHAARIAELKGVKVRFAFDHSSMETIVHDAIELARKHGLRNFGVYVLIGFKDTPEEARYRLDKVVEWKCKPAPMRYQPLNALQKDTHLEATWTAREIKRMQEYYFNLRFVGHVPFEEFKVWGQGELFDLSVSPIPAKGQNRGTTQDGFSGKALDKSREIL